jgi:hypothetical protein
MRIFILILTFSVLFQQHVDCQLVGVRPNAGGSFANMESLDSQGDTNTGLNGGIGFDIALTQSPNYPLRVSPEIFIKQKGSNNFVNSNNFTGFQGIDLTYVGLYMPFTLAVGPDNGSTLFQGIMIQVNAFMDYAFGTTAIASDGAPIADPFGKRTEKVDFGFGANIQFHSSQLGGIVLGYNWGLHNINFVDNVSREIYAKNRGFFVNATYSINTQ